MGAQCSKASPTSRKTNKKKKARRPRVAELTSRDDETTLNNYRQILIDEEVIAEDEEDLAEAHGRDMASAKLIRVESSCTPRSGAADVGSVKSALRRVDSSVEGGSTPRPPFENSVQDQTALHSPSSSVSSSVVPAGVSDQTVNEGAEGAEGAPSSWVTDDSTNREEVKGGLCPLPKLFCTTVPPNLTPREPQELSFNGSSTTIIVSDILGNDGDGKDNSGGPGGASTSGIQTLRSTLAGSPYSDCGPPVPVSPLLALGISSSFNSSKDCSSLTTSLGQQHTTLTLGHHYRHPLSASDCSIPGISPEAAAASPMAMLNASWTSARSDGGSNTSSRRVSFAFNPSDCDEAANEAP